MIKLILLLSIAYVALASLTKEEITKLKAELDEELLKLDTKKVTKSGNNDAVATVEKDTKKKVASVEDDEDKLLLNLLKHDSTKPAKDSPAKKPTKDDGGEAKTKAALAAELGSMSKKEVEITKSLLESFIQDEAEKKEAESSDEFFKALKDDEKLKKKDAKKELTEDEISEKLMQLYIQEDTKKTKKEVCEDTDANYCKSIKQYCKTHEKPRNKCPKTCGICGDGAPEEEVEVQEVCVDKAPHCESMKAACQTHMLQMEEQCAKTCGFCKVCPKDIWSEDTCKKAKKLMYCAEGGKHYEKLKHYCHTTCGFCRTPSPPECSRSTEGCCWDNKGFVADGCPACKDNPVIGMVCKRFIDDCTSNGVPGKFMKHNCPLTCNFCDPSCPAGIRCNKKASCSDKPGIEKTCNLWMKAGKCEKLKEFTKEWCPKSCKFCAE